MSGVFPSHLDHLKKVHIIGACGTLMGAFACFLKRRGIGVTGSDENVYPPMSDVLRSAGVSLYSGYRPENLNLNASRPDLIVIGNVIRRDNPEAQAALASGVPSVSLPEFMERLLLKETRNIVVAGTHGKTTTSSWIAHVLNQASQDPSYFIGGVSQDLPHSFHVSRLDQGSLFVLEGDEYDTAFWDKVPKFNHYLPDETILTSIEYDHADIYPDLKAVVSAFRGLIQRIRKGGRLIACTDYAEVCNLIKEAQVPVITYGLKSGGGPAWTPADVQISATGTRFKIQKAGVTVAEIQTQLSGAHNVLNAMAVFIQCSELGLSPEKILAGLKSFKGVKRRQEVRGELAGVTVIDDFAHHPTAVLETLRGLKARYSGKRLVTVFEPRSATSRRKVFQAEYVRAFLEADSIWIAAPYDQSRIVEAERFSSEELVNDLKAQSKEAAVFTSVDDGVKALAATARAGDVVAVLSNGGFGGFIPKLIDALKNKA